MKTIQEYTFTLSILKKLYLEHIVISDTSEDLSKILITHPKLVIALNHGHMTGALAGLIGVSEMFQQHGGSTRTPFGITWRTFYQLPVSKQIFSYLTQVDKGIGFEDANDLLKNSGFSDCFIMPEGELCNFGDGLKIQPFLSPRFIELAIRNNLPVLIVAHQGSENWAWPVKIKKRYRPLLSWLPKNMKEGFNYSGIISIPKPFKAKISELYMSFYLYQPSLKEKDLEKDKDKRMIQLTTEADKVRTKMQAMMYGLKNERKEKSES